MDIEEAKTVRKFIEKHEKFHIVVDNDMFIMYSTRPPHWEDATDEEYNKWVKKSKTISIYSNPVDLLPIILDIIGGTCSWV